MRKIGRLYFKKDSPCGKGQFGPVFQGKLDELINVSIEQMDKSQFKVDTKLLMSLKHVSILMYYTVEQDAEF